MPLYLTGGGDQEDFRNLDRLFLEHLPENSQILVIPLACEEDEYEDALDRAEECFESSKVKNIELCEDVDKLSYEDLLNFQAVFIEGGNTFKLIQAVRKSSFFDLLKKYLSDGNFIYADSAGAIVLGSNVQTAFLGDDGDEDENKLQDYRGLGLLGDWVVHCHYEPNDHDDMQDLMYDLGTPILALSEPCGIYINGDEVEVKGKEALEIFTFSGRTVHQPNSKIELSKIISGE